MESVSTNDIEYFLPAEFPAPRVISRSDPLSPQDYKKLGYGPSYRINIDGTNCIIYTDRLHWLLKCKTVEVANINNDFERVIIDGTSYQQSYKNGFVSGINYFNEKYRLDFKTIIESLDTYIKILIPKCFEDCHYPLWSPGWQGVRYSHIGKFSHTDIQDHGYYAGLYHQVELLMNRLVFV